MTAHLKICKCVACAVLLSCSTSAAKAGSDDWLVSIHCDTLQRAGDVIRANENTSVVDINWDGYSLVAGQTIAQKPSVARDEKLFKMIVEACGF